MEKDYENVKEKVIVAVKMMELLEMKGMPIG